MSFYVTTPSTTSTRSRTWATHTRDRRRHPRAPHAPARRGRVLLDRHRRARRADRRRGSCPGGLSTGTCRRYAARFKALLPRLEASNDFFIRTTDPEHELARPAGPPARARERPHLQGHVRGLVLPALRRLQGRERDPRRQPLPDPRDRARAPPGGELVLCTVDLPGAARALVRRPTRLRDAPAPYNEALSFITSGLQDISLSRQR